MATTHTHGHPLHHGAGARREQRVAPGPSERVLENLGDGLLSGGIGGAAVALGFLFVDFIAREPLWTPSFLGGAIFEGKVAADVVIALDTVALFSILHGLAFVAVASTAAMVLRGMERVPSIFRIAGALFVALHLGLLLVDVLVEPAALMRGIGHVPALLMNVVAAFGMAAYLRYLQPHPRARVEA